MIVGLRSPNLNQVFPRRLNVPCFIDTSTFEDGFIPIPPPFHPESGVTFGKDRILELGFLPCSPIIRTDFYNNHTPTTAPGQTPNFIEPVTLEVVAAGG